MSKQGVVLRVSLKLAICAGWFSLGLAYGQEGKLIILDHADSLVGKVVDGENVRELVGNVRFRQENVIVSCNRAVQYLAAGNILLTGRVVVQDDSVVLRAPRAMYFRDGRRAEAFDSVSLDDGRVRLTARYGEYFVEPKRAFFRTGVVLRDTGSVLKSDSLTYFRTEQYSVARGNVSIFNMADNVTIRGAHFENDRGRRFSRMLEHPVLIQLDTATSGRIDTLVVRSRLMESHQEPFKRLVAIDSVEIVRSELNGVAGLAIFYTEGDSIVLRSSPVIWYGNTQVSGDSINVYLLGRKLHRVEVMGNAFAISQNDTLYENRFDQITGDLMVMEFAEQELRKLEVTTRAITVYHLYEDTTANGLNRTSGDRIVMVWEEGKLSAIKVFGGIEGQYYPENLVNGREPEYTLPGFHWRTDRPRIRESDFGRRPSAISSTD